MKTHSLRDAICVAFICVGVAMMLFSCVTAKHTAKPVPVPIYAQSKNVEKAIRALEVQELDSPITELTRDTRPKKPTDNDNDVHLPQSCYRDYFTSKTEQEPLNFVTVYDTSCGIQVDGKACAFIEGLHSDELICDQAK